MLDTSKVEQMISMFRGCKNLNFDILSKFSDVSNVITMEEMFVGCEVDGRLFANWTPSSVSNISYMFSGARIKNTINVTNFYNVSASDYNQNFITGTTLVCAFEYAVVDMIDISGLIMTQNTDIYQMFKGTTCSSGCSNLEHHVKHDGVPSDDWQRLLNTQNQ
jgi:surface protein